MEDLIIIGYGVTGLAALIKANELGVKPVIIGHGPMVGLTLIETRNKGIDVDYRVVKLPMWLRPIYLVILGGLAKMIIEKPSKRVIGFHMIGEYAAEIINEAALAVRLRATIDDIIDTVHVSPTMAEIIKLAAQSFYRDVSKMSCCVD